MPDKDFNSVFSRRLKYYLEQFDMTQVDFAKKIGVGTTSVYNWLSGIKTPRMDKIDAMCYIFHCTRSDLMEDSDDNADTGYYTDQETAEIAQEIFENKELRILFDAAKHASPEDLKVAHDMLLALKRKEQG